MYAITNAYDIKDALKDLGGKWDAERKAWVISQEALDKCNARTHSYGMAWVKGWAKAHVEAI